MYEPIHLVLLEGRTVCLKMDLLIPWHYFDLLDDNLKIPLEVLKPCQKFLNLC